MHISVRSRSASALTVAAALGVLLAGCDSGTDPVSAAPSASGAHCGFDTADSFVVVTSAELQGSTVVVTSNPAHFVCGGADNGHFETDADTTTLALAPSADVELLAGSGPDLDPAPVPQADLPARLAEDSGALFEVTGPDTAVTGLTEVYQP